MTKNNGMVISVIGTGAIGGYYGAKLARGGEDVHFLLHKDIEFVKEHGLKVTSVNGDFELPKVNAYSSSDSMPKSDLVIVALKSVKNDALKELLPPLLKKDTLLLLIQNGIGVEEDVQKMFPGLWIAAGMAFICSAKNEPGHVCHYDYGSINIGNYSCPDKAVISRLIDTFKRCGVEAAELEYGEGRWKKAVWNVPFNGMTVAYNTTTDALLANPETRKLARTIMSEVIAAAQAFGVRNVDEAFADKMMDMTDRMTPYAPSMKLDYDNGRPMEIYYLYTNMLGKAKVAGVEMPETAKLEAKLKELNCKI